MNKKILVTGASGFAGSHLIDYLLKKEAGDKIIATYITEKSLENIKDAEGKISTVQLDLQDEEKTTKLIESEKPDEIYHLAAFPSVSDSFSSPKETVVNNISAELTILEALKRNNLKDTRVLIISSAEVYGEIEKEDLPIDEETNFNPTNPYAVSKIAQEYFGKQYLTSYKIKSIIARPFNHIGPRQNPDFVISSFCKKIAEIEKGGESVLKVGRLESKRDFTDVRDVVRAYYLLMEKGVPGETYNIGSGRSYKISDILDILLSLSNKKFTIETDQSLVRPIDTPELVCDFTKLKDLTDWEPEISIKNTLMDTLDYWRNII